MDDTRLSAGEQTGLFGSASIEVVKVVRERGQLFAAFTDGRHNWLMPVEPKDLQSFQAFQRRALTECGVWVEHWSQDRARPAHRAEDWRDEIRRAVDRGGCRQ